MSSTRRVELAVAIYAAATLACVLMSAVLVQPRVPAEHFAEFQILSFLVPAALTGAMLLVVIRTLRQEIQDQAALRQAAEGAQRRDQADLSTLEQTIARSNSGADQFVLLQALCMEVAYTLNVDAATVMLYSPQRGTIELGAAHGLPEDFRENFRSVSFRSNIPRLLRYHNPVVLQPGSRDLSDLPNSGLYQQQNFGSLALMPLRSSGEFLGEVTAIGLQREIQFSAAQLALLTAFADQASMVVRNARLVADVQDYMRRLGVLRTGDLAILSSLDLDLTLEIFLQQVKSELDADAAAVLMLNQGTQKLEYGAGLGFTTALIKETSVALGEGFAGRVALERRSLYEEDIVHENPSVRKFTRQAMADAENFITYFGVPLISKGQVKGILEVFHRSAFRPTEQWQSFLETLAGQAAIAIENATLFSNLARTNADLMLAYDRTLEGWSRALDMRDRETEGHTERVTALALQLARELNLTDEDMIQMRRGAILHDIGKMGVPDEILHKPGKLNAKEHEMMEKHPVYALELLSPVNYLRAALDIPYAHHERWDGSGYPRGLKGDVIPLPARIFAVADVWDALTSSRPYRKAWPKARALQYLREQAGKTLDPTVVRVFLAMMNGTGTTKT
jgi:putative nucleotidyltransferase with HDIG domain